MENLSHEQILKLIDPDTESSLLFNVKRLKLSGFVLNNMEYDTACKIFSNEVPAKELINFKNRTSMIGDTLEETLAEPKSNEQEIKPEWPEKFVFPTYKLSDKSNEDFKNPEYKITNKDMVEIVKTLFDEMVAYDVLYPTTEQYSEAIESVVEAYPVLLRNDPKILDKLRLKLRTKYINHRRLIQDNEQVFKFRLRRKNFAEQIIAGFTKELLSLPACSNNSNKKTQEND